MNNFKKGITLHFEKCDVTEEILFCIFKREFAREQHKALSDLTYREFIPVVTLPKCFMYYDIKTFLSQHSCDGTIWQSTYIE